MISVRIFRGSDQLPWNIMNLQTRNQKLMAMVHAYYGNNHQWPMQTELLSELLQVEEENRFGISF